MGGAWGSPAMISPLSVVAGTHGRSGRSGAMSSAEVAQPASQTEDRTAAMASFTPAHGRSFLALHVPIGVATSCSNFASGASTAAEIALGAARLRRRLWIRARPPSPMRDLGFRGGVETLREPFKAAAPCPRSRRAPDRRRSAAALAATTGCAATSRRSSSQAGAGRSEDGS